MGFGQGLSGLNAASQNLDVIGNNIANASTIGFKAATASFADVYATSRVGLGVQVAAINQRFATGSIVDGNGSLNMALNDKGFFRLQDTTGGVVYSRNGEFGLDKDNYVVNALGQRLTGYPGGGVGQDPVALQLSLGDVAPVATTTAQLTANLRAGATPIPATPAFDITNPDTYTNRSTMTVYDSLGNGHTMDQYFIKREGAGGNSIYEVRYVLDGTEQGTPQQLTFNENGTLVTPLTPVSITFPNPGGTTSPADDLTIAFNYGKVTQFAGDFSNTPLPNGNASGTFTGLAVGADGSIVASYSSGAKTVIGTVALARFNNEMGLTPIGGNAWSESPESGQPVLGQPGTNSLSTITGGKLEASNVNTSDELVNMIIAQRTYQANAQTIKTQDQVLQTLLQIR